MLKYNPGRAAARLTGAALLATALAAGATLPSAPKDAIEVLGEYRTVVKTPTGREGRLVRSEYNWSDGRSYQRFYNDAGELVDTTVGERAPSPSAEQIAFAVGLVNNDPEVREMRRRQSGLVADGGFMFETDTGVCGPGSRCVQIFLFDGENVVRHMLVDLKTESIVNHDYVPPRNRRTK